MSDEELVNAVVREQQLCLHLQLLLPSLQLLLQVELSSQCQHSVNQ